MDYFDKAVKKHCCAELKPYN